MTEEHRLRARVERKLGRTIPDHTWTWLDEKGFVADGLADESELLEAVRAMSPPGGFRPPKDALDDTLQEREAALSAWAARLAREETRVEQWRKRARLHAGLLDAADVNAWVEEREATDGGRGRRLFWLGRETDGEWTVCMTEVAEGSVLGDLVALGENLSRDFRWHEPHEAVMFVLTGEQPWVHTIAGSWRGQVASKRLECGRWITIDAYGAVTITIDPAVTPEQLATWWRAVRRETFGHQFRQQSPKHAALAGFMAERSSTSRWAASCKAWNEDHPEWRYERVGHFQRDAVAAMWRLLNTGFFRGQLRQRELAGEPKGEPPVVDEAGQRRTA